MAAAYGALAFAVLGVTWSAIFIRWAAVPGASSAFYRVFIAAAVLVPWWTAAVAASPEFRETVRRVNRRAVLFAAAGGAFFALDLALYNTAVLRTTATSATLLGNHTPIFVGIGTWLLFGRRPRRAFWLGLALALIGAAIVVADNAGHRVRGAGDPAGDMLALTASVFFAAYLLTTERMREQLNTLTFSTAAIVGSVVTLLIVCVILDVPLSGFSMRTWGALLGLGLISQLAAYFSLAYALGHLPATTTSVGLLAQTPLTALLAIPLLGERARPALAVGAALALAGIYIVIRGKN
jgi:drug/metabolite transporter (DMT)-like permease